MYFDSSEDHARSLDEQDELAGFREQFFVPPGTVYLDGNSLGLCSHAAEVAVVDALRAWREYAIGGWTDADQPWFTLAEELGRLTAPLVGAEADEVIVTNSTTVNLHQLLSTLYRPRGERTRILVDELAFPSDLYAVRSHLELRDRNPLEDLVLVRSPDGFTLSEDAIITAMDERVAVAVLPSVLYVSGQLLDMARLIHAAHERGILIGFDCSHSIGVLPHAFDEWEADFAFWCGYKYLNGGPGSAAGLYLNRRHFGRSAGMSGWFGSMKEEQFTMAPELRPAYGAGALQVGTPNILSMAPLHGTLRMIREAGIEAIRRKSLELTRYLRESISHEVGSAVFEDVTPREDVQRGGHIALGHPEAIRICRALRDLGVVPDFRPPRVIRLAPVALYTSFADCHKAIQRLKRIMDSKLYESYEHRRELVT